MLKNKWLWVIVVLAIALGLWQYGIFTPAEVVTTP